MLVLGLGLVFSILYALMLFLIVMYNLDEHKHATQLYRRGYIKLTLVICGLNALFLVQFVIALFKIQVN